MTVKQNQNKSSNGRSISTVANKHKIDESKVSKNKTEVKKGISNNSLWKHKNHYTDTRKTNLRSNKINFF